MCWKVLHYWDQEKEDQGKENEESEDEVTRNSDVQVPTYLPIYLPIYQSTYLQGPLKLKDINT